MGLRFGVLFAKKLENNLWLVYCVVGNKSKLRKHPKICMIANEDFNTKLDEKSSNGSR
jgi:hypothetical protein